MNSKREKQLNDFYKKYMDLLLGDAPLDTVYEIAVQNVMGYGTTLDEKIMEVERLRKMVVDQREQGTGIEMSFDIKPVFRRMSPKEDSAIIVDEIDIKMIIDGNENILPIRVGSVLEFIDDRWKVVHLHGSVGVKSDDDTWHKDELKHKMEELQNLVDEKTLDLQQKNRELEIEAALERVRARSMAMLHSRELVEVVRLLDKEIKGLGIQFVDATQIVTDFSNPDEGLNIWITVEGVDYLQKFHVPYFDHPTWFMLSEALKKGQNFYTEKYLKAEKNRYFRLLFKYSDFGRIPKERQAVLLHAPGLVKSYVIHKNSILLFQHNGLNEFSAEDNAIFRRFGAVFEQTYTRFLDLQKAEAHAREAQIEAALERVRSRSMGMHSSDELKDVVRLLYKEFRILVTDIDSVNIQLNLGSSKGIHYWASVEEDIYLELYHVPYSDLPIFEKFYNAFNLPGEGFLDYLLNKEEKDALFSELFKIQPVPPKRKKMIQNAEGMVMMGWFHKYSGIDILHYNLERFSEEQKEIVKRFAAAFEQTYIRFLDLQKAEAQAREAEIQLALERVRARTMAMHKSDELAETAAILFQQMKELGVTPERINICLIKEADNILEVWATDQQGMKISHHFNASLDEPTTGKQVYDAWKEKKKSIIIDLSGKELNDWIRYVREVMGMTIKSELVREHRIHSVAFFSQGMILTTTPEPLPEESIKLLERFADVFNLTYRRFLDLQKAETQAREAQIEAALERVRSLALGMRKSDDVGKVTDSFFAEFKKLTVKIIGCSIIVADEKNDNMEIWRARADLAVRPFSKSSFSRTMNMTKESMPELFPEYRKALGSKKGYMQVILSGEKRLRFLNINSEQNGFNPRERERFIKTMPAQFVASFLFFKLGYLALISEKELPEENLKIARRFADVFDFAYTRFLDLQKAEAQAREAIKQASLDRVRGEIASMRTSEELNRITPVIWRELQALEVPFIRCGVFIIEEEKQKVHVYLTTPDGKALGVLNLSFDANELTSNTVKNWRTKQIYKEHWNKEEFINWTKSMIELGQVQSPETYQGSSTAPESLNLHFVPFRQGMLYVGDVSPLSDEKLDLVKTLAEAFSIAYARYEDFKSLEEAKNKIEITLRELKSAQAQLIHAEKLASLGELTAGIAHEIKNPLNFVNNFSEISRELLDEMKTELQNKNEEEVNELIEDLQQNLDKINQHGKRADSIVKGMLLHSRGSSGEKTLTDINNLLDEYVNLAYHGMRAQNKEFNIKIEREYDKTLEKINVIPQDISRVFLNIINNACYAAYDKKKKSGDNFSPTLKVSTKNLNSKVEIHISDNGNGIPKNIIDKIFQPFFTTKPTGEGTGLGLSLSYDIVTKVHGGELKVETKEGNGTKFIIQIPG